MSFLIFLAFPAFRTLMALKNGPLKSWAWHSFTAWLSGKQEAVLRCWVASSSKCHLGWWLCPRVCSVHLTGRNGHLYLNPWTISKHDMQFGTNKGKWNNSQLVETFFITQKSWINCFMEFFHIYTYILNFIYWATLLKIEHLFWLKLIFTFVVNNFIKMREEPYHRGKGWKYVYWKEVQKRLSGKGGLRDHKWDEADWEPDRRRLAEMGTGRREKGDDREVRGAEAFFLLAQGLEQICSSRQDGQPPFNHDNFSCKFWVLALSQRAPWWPLFFKYVAEGKNIYIIHLCGP